MDEEIQALMALLPGLEMRFDRMKADLLLRLLSRRDAVADNMLALRRELPDADIAAMVARYPALVADFTPQQLVDRIAAVRCPPPPHALMPRPRCKFARTTAATISSGHISRSGCHSVAGVPVDVGYGQEGSVCMLFFA